MEKGISRVPTINGTKHPRRDCERFGSLICVHLLNLWIARISLFLVAAWPRCVNRRNLWVENRCESDGRASGRATLPATSNTMPGQAIIGRARLKRPARKRSETFSGDVE